MKKIKIIIISTCLFSFTFFNTVKADQGSDKKTLDTQQKLESILNSVKTEIKDDKTEKTVTKKKKSSYLEIDGLIIDQTQSKIAHDFYDTFFANWLAPEEFREYTILIIEKKQPRNGCLVCIEINNDLIFQSILSPRNNMLEEIAKNGVLITTQYLQKRHRDQKMLSGDEAAGSGIF